MEYIIYILAAISIVLAVVGLAYSGPKKNWVILSSVFSILLSLIAIYLVSFWPLAISFSLNWLFKLFGGELTKEEIVQGLTKEE